MKRVYLLASNVLRPVSRVWYFQYVSHWRYTTTQPVNITVSSGCCTDTLKAPDRDVIIILFADYKKYMIYVKTQAIIKKKFFNLFQNMYLIE